MPGLAHIRTDTDHDVLAFEGLGVETHVDEIQRSVGGNGKIGIGVRDGAFGFASHVHGNPGRAVIRALPQGWHGLSGRLPHRCVSGNKQSSIRVLHNHGLPGQSTESFDMLRYYER